MNLSAAVDAVPLNDLEQDAEYFEYTSSANPLGARLISPVPYHAFPASLYVGGPSRIVPLDLSTELDCEGPATGPTLCANFIRVVAGETLEVDAVASSKLAYVIGGRGRAAQGDVAVDFAQGDFFSLPGDDRVVLAASTDLSLYYVHDAPLLRYLGVKPAVHRFTATHYPADRARAELAQVAADEHAGRRNRISILLGNRNFPQSRTITHTLWAMLGVVMPHSEQKPHRHQSIALDFIAACSEGCYTLVGQTLDEQGRIIHPKRVDWKPGMAFVTPPGHWHAHFNASAQPAYVIPIQDAGLQTYMRTLDIRFGS